MNTKYNLVLFLISLYFSSVSYLDHPSNVRQTYKDGGFSEFSCIYEGRAFFSTVENCTFTYGYLSNDSSFSFNPSSEGYQSFHLNHFIDPDLKEAFERKSFSLHFKVICNKLDLQAISDEHHPYVECEAEYQVENNKASYVGTSINFFAPGIEVDEFRSACKDK